MAHSDATEEVPSQQRVHLLRLLRFAGAACVAILFGWTLHVLARELSATPPQKILQEAQQIPAFHLILSVLLTILNYSVLTLYDVSGLHYAGHPLPYRKTAVASFIAYVFSHNSGFAEVSGMALRFRIYTAWGLNAIEITKAAIFGVVTYWLGLLLMGGVVFAIIPQPYQMLTRLPANLFQGMGYLFLSLILVYMLACLRMRKPLSIFAYRITLPSPRLACLQLGLALADWLTASGVLYTVLLPTTGMSYTEFLAVYIVAITAGSVSHVPAGIGVVESIFLLALAGRADPGAIIGSLLVYRAIYYLLPLIPGIIILLGLELGRVSTVLTRLARAAQPWFSAVAPSVFALFTFLSGWILLVSGATPEDWSRLHILEAFMPLAFIEVSHLLASIMGVALLITARGLLQRLDGAFLLTLMFLGAGVVLSLMKGFDYEEACFLIISMLLLFPCRGLFYRKSSLLEARFSPSWVMAILSTVVASAWLAVLAHENIANSSEIWRNFSPDAGAPRAFRASLAAAVTLLVAGLAWLLHPSHRSRALQTTVDNTIRSIVQSSQRTIANLAFTGDKEFLVNPARTAFIMFARRGRNWIAMGDPLGTDEEITELVWQFRSVCDAYAGRAVFYQIDAEGLHRYIDAGFYVTKIGEEAIIDLRAFHLEGRKFKDLRNARNKLNRMGCRFELVPAADVPLLIPKLKEISDAWLAMQKTREKGFSIGSFSQDYLRNFSVAIIRSPSRIEAFANLWQAHGGAELSIDLMRYLPDAPHGIMDFLLCEIMLWGQTQRFRSFNLGMAPLAGLSQRSPVPAWVRLETLIYRHGEHFYNFRGLRAYKEKWGPQWYPKYLATSTGLALPAVFGSLAVLVGGGWRGTLMK
jgi:phosphatidylglycerol lysyltransferase